MFPPYAGCTSTQDLQDWYPVMSSRHVFFCPTKWQLALLFWPGERREWRNDKELRWQGNQSNCPPIKIVPIGISQLWLPNFKSCSFNSDVHRYESGLPLYLTNNFTNVSNPKLSNHPPLIIEYYAFFFFDHSHRLAFLKYYYYGTCIKNPMSRKEFFVTLILQNYAQKSERFQFQASNERFMSNVRCVTHEIYATDSVLGSHYWQNPDANH